MISLCKLPFVTDLNVLLWQKPSKNTVEGNFLKLIKVPFKTMVRIALLGKECQKNINKRKNVSCHDFVKSCFKVLANMINQEEKLIF